MVEPLLMKRLLTILCNRSGKSANALRFFVSQVIAIEIRVGWAGFFAHPFLLDLNGGQKSVAHMTHSY